MKMNRLNLRKTRKLKLWAQRLGKPSALAGSIAVLAVSAITAALTSATNFWWDSSGVVEPGQSISTGFGLGGAGTYDAVAPRFWDGVSPVDVPTVTLADIVFFAGQSTGGVITFNAPLIVNGLTFTTGGYSTLPTAVNTITLDGTVGKPVIAADANATIGTTAVAGIAGTSGFSKAGAGTLTVVGNNTGLSGSIIVNGGTLISSGNITSLGSGDFILQLGTLSLRNDGTATPGVAATYTNNIFVNGNATLNVDRVAANAGNTIVINSLSINNSQLTITNGNTYGLQVTGTTSLAGPLSTISTALTFTAGNANPTNNMVALSGGVTGAGALNKLGTGTVNLFGSGNSYSGGTNIFAGAITLADTNAQAGTGNIIVNPGAAIAFTDVKGATLTGTQTLSVQSAANSLGIIRFDSTVSDIVSGSSLVNAFISPYGAAFEVNTGAVNYTVAGVPALGATYSQNINLGAVGNAGPGNGPIYFGASANTTISGNIKAAADNVLRLGGTGVLTLATLNQLSAANPGLTALTFGTPVANVFAVTNGSGTFAINNANALTVPITVNRLATVQVAGILAGTENPLGTGIINILGGTLDTTASIYAGAAPQLGNGTINVYQNTAATAGLRLDNSAVITAGGTTDLRLAPSAVLGLYSGNLTYSGANLATTTTTQNIATINASGGSTINVTTSANPANNSDAVLVVGNLQRQNNGAVSFLRLGATQPAQFGLTSANSDSRVVLTQINGAAPVVFATASGSGMIAPWLVDGGNVAAPITFGGFLTHNANGIAPVTYDDTNFAATAANKITDVTATSAPASTSVYALRIGGATGGAFGLTGTNTITIGASASAADGAGLILNTITAAQTNTPNFTFGTAGNREAVIYAAGGQNNTLSGIITASGLTKFGPSAVLLTGLNTGLTGTITLNQGTFNVTPIAANFLPITLNAGILQINAAANANIYNSAITVNGDSSLDTGTNLLPRIRTLTINARAGGSTDPITLSSVAGGLAVTGTAGQAALTLNGPLNLNQVTGGNQYIFGNGALGTAAISGAGALNKFGSGQVIIASSSAAFTGAITINGVGGNNNNNVLRSQDAKATDRPFGTGAIVVNPGGVLSVALPAANTASNASVTLNSDLNGLATIAANYNGNVALPSVTTFNNPSLNGPFSAVLAIDAVGFSGPVDQAVFGTGVSFLGSANQTGNFTGTLTPSGVGLLNSVPNTGLGGPFATSAAAGVYRIGAGGGTLQFLGGPGQFGVGNDIQVGAINNVHQFTSVSLANGNGSAAIYNVNAGFNGNIILNGSTNTQGQGNLIVGNDAALGTGTIIFNGGGIQSDTNTGLPFFTPVRTISNVIQFAGDAVFNGSTNLNVTSALALAPGQSGVTRTFNVANTTGVTILSGAITDGAGGSVNSINKTGAGPLVLAGGGLNTYTGFTNLSAGTIVVGSDADIPLSSQIVFNAGALGVWNTSFTTNRSYVATATTSIFDIGAVKTLTQGVLSNLSGNTTLVKNGLGTMIVTGANSMNGTNAVQINNGILQIGANIHLGDPSVNGQIVAGATAGIGAGNATALGGGALRAVASFTTNRVILPNTNTTTSITLDVLPGVTLTSAPLVPVPALGLAAAILRNNGTGVFTTIKTGAGTYLNTSNNSEIALQIENGIFQSSSNAPWSPAVAAIGNGTTTNAANTLTGLTSTANLFIGQAVSGTGIAAGTFISAITSATALTLSANATASGTVTISAGQDSTVALNGGTLLLANTAGNQAVASSGGANGFTFGGGGHLALQSAATFSSQLTVPNINRAGVGTLILDPGTSTLAVAGNANNVRVIPTTLINTVAVASANTNGILPGNIVTETAGVGSFAAYDTAATGIKTFTGYTVTTGPALGATTAATVLDVTGPVTAFTTPVQSVYAVRTNSNISGGTLKIVSVNGTTASNEGGLIVNANATVGANLVFDPTAAAGATAASGEGLIYVAPSATATLTGNLLATSLVKFGTGALTLNGAGQNILNALTVQEGTLRVATASNFDKTQTDLVLNNQGTLDLNGQSATFNSLGNSTPATVMGGLITNTTTTPAAFTVNLSTTATASVSTALTQTGTPNQNNQLITALTSTANLVVGMPVFGLNVAAGATIQSIDSATQVTVRALGNNANVTAVASTLSFGPIFFGQIADGAGGGTVSLAKSGTGTLALGGFHANNPDAGNNSFSGGTTVNLGTLLVENPLALGGFITANNPTGTAGAITLAGGTLDLRSNGGGINGTITLGNQAGPGSTVNVSGAATINVDRVAANSGNAWQIGTLNLSENNLTTTGANNYFLRVAGTTTILGNFASITSGSASASGTLELAGRIVAPNGGALNKFGADQSRYLVIDNGAAGALGNTYSGGTNIQSGALIVNTTTGTPLGTGRVNVFGNGTLRLTGVGAWANGTVGGAPVKVLSAFNALAAVGLDNDNFDPVPWLNAAGVLNNSYGTVAIALSRPFYTRALDQSVIGDGRTFLTGGINAEVSYIAPTLAPGLGDGAVSRIYRLAGGGNNNLAFTGVDNVLSDFGSSTQVQIGSPTSIANNGALGQSGGTVVIRNSNNYTGGTIIWKGSGLQIETGASPNAASNSPLGSGVVDIWGTLTSAGQNGSFVDGTTGNNRNTFALHPGGQITINDVAGTVTGGQGRWADATGLNLNGGTLQFNGVTGYVSVETVGTLTVDKLSRIVVNRSATAGVATINTPGLTRIAAGGANGAGALLLQGSANGSFGIPASVTVTTADNANYDRLIITGTAPTLGGNTTIGSGVTAGIAAAGVAPVWIINTNDAAGLPNFVTYSPTTAGGNTGFQGLVSAGSPGATATASVAATGIYSVGANQVGFSRFFGTGTGAPAIVAGLTAGTETVDLSGAATLTLVDAATSVYALRTNRDLNPLAGASPSLTIVSGGLIAVTNNLTLNNAPVPNNAGAQNMTLNFGVAGAGEAIIYSQVNTTINAQIRATGLTKTTTQNNGGQIILTGDNLLTGPVTIDGGLIIAQNTLSGTGAAVPGVFNGQNVYLSGGVGAANVRLIINGTVGNAVSALQPSAFAATTRLGGTIFVNGDSQLDNNNNGIAQRITNLTFVDLGVQKPIALLLGSNIYVEGTTTLASNTALNMFFNNSYSSTLAGQVSGPASLGALAGVGDQLNKYGNGLLLLSNATNNYTGGTTINSSGGTTTSILGSSVRTGTPFGSGSITVNPGGALRILDAGNIASNVVNVISDGLGLGGLNFGYTATSAQIAALFGTGAGRANFTSSGDFTGVIGLDANNWNGAINIATLESAAVAANPALAGKPLWIGTSNNPTQTYINSGVVNYAGATITPGRGNVLRIGGGGVQGSLAFGAGQFENVITAATTAILVGTDTAGINANGPVYINGAIGMLDLTTRNLAFTGSVTVAGGSQLTFSNGNALANVPVITVNGGGLNIRNNQTVPNAIIVTGDQFRTGENTGFDGGTFSGTVNLAPGGVGGTRTFSAASNAIGFTGILSDGGTGTGASNIIRTSTQSNNNLGQIIFHAANTYHGTTEIRGGFLYAGTDVQSNVAGAFGISDTPISVAIAANPGGNSAAQIGIAGQFTFGRDIIFGTVAPTGNAVTELRSSTLQTAVVTGGISLSFGAASAGTGVAVSATSTANGIGGTLDLQGPITGAGGLEIGAVVTTAAGIVRLSANSNGIGTNTFTGGVNIFQGRLQISSDTNFTGTAAAPVILSGPLGTGALFLGRQGSNTAGQGNQNPGFVEIDAVGADRVIVNSLGALNSAAVTINFGGHQSLTFTSAMDVNSATSLQNRSFSPLETQGTTTFLGNLTNSGVQGVNFLKAGAGTLILSGTNTQQNLLTTDGNYGTTVFLDAGVLSVSADAALGLATVTAASGTGGAPHTAGSASDLRLRGGILQVTGSFSSARNFVFSSPAAAASAVTTGFDVTTGNTLTLTASTANSTTGNAAPSATTLVKIGGGTLALNGAANAGITNLTIGGFTTGGGTISSTATGGTPFGAATGTIIIGTGTLAIGGGTAAQSFTTNVVDARAGSNIQLTKGAFGAALNATNTAPTALAAVATTAGSTTVTATSTTGMAAGQLVYGTNILPGTTVASVTNGTTFVLSQPAIATATAQTATFSSGLARGNFATQGTLTLQPSVLANLGAGAAATSENFTANNYSTTYTTVGQFTNLNGMLAFPFVDTRLAGAGQDANFVQYGANGFTPHGTTTVATINGGTATDATKLGDITAAGTTAAAGTNNVFALRTAGNITPTDATTLVGIGNGGVIINGATAPNISANLTFTDAGRAVTNASGSTAVTGLATTADLAVGMLVSGAGILPGTTIAAINSTTAITLNQATNAAATNFAATKEAIVFVRDGQTGGSVIANYSTLSGQFTATNFTKSGPGNLLISGTGNVMAPINSGVGIRVLSINEGALQFAGQGSVPSGGNILVNTMDTGVLDVAGQSFTFAGLGTGQASLAAGTGSIVNSGAAATLTLNGSGNGTGILTTQSNGLISGNLALVKSGSGTQILGANTVTGFGGNTFTGGTTINAGYITSASGLFTPLGTLQVRGVNTLGTGAITLAGGNLEFNNAIVGSDMFTNIASVLQGGVNGYDVTVAAVNGFGSANTTSTFTTTNTVNWQAINSLTVNAPVITFAGGSANGVLVKGTTTFNQDTTINVTGTGQALFAGNLSAPGRTLTKIGATALFLTGTGGAANGTGGAANIVGGWNVLAGTLEVRTADGGANPLGGTLGVVLNGGTLNLRHDGDNFADPQNIATFNTDTIVVGSLVAASSANYTDSLNSTLQVGTLSAGANKTIQLPQVQFGGPLGTAFLTTAAINGNYSIEFTNGLTMIKDAYLGIGNQVTIDTALSGNGTLVKQGAGELDINTVAANSGGTVSVAGTINFGTFQGNTRTLSTTAKLAPGNITLNPSALIRFNSPTNLNGAQIVDLRSNVTNYAVVGIGDNSPLGSYNLRVPQAFGAPSSNLLFTPNHGGGVIALNSVYSQPINLALIGDGTFFLGSNNNGAGSINGTSVNGTYVGATAIGASPVSYNFGAGNAANANPTYRLGGGGAFLNIGTIGGTEIPALVNTVPCTTLGSLTPVALVTNVVVGAPLTNTNNNAGAVVGNGTTAGVFFNTAQTYTGTTLVNSGSTLEIRNSVTTSGYETFGTLAVGGSGGTFAGGPTPVVHPGATIRLDNSLDLLPVASVQGRWGDATAVVLDGSTFTLSGNSGVDIREVVGAVTVNGFSTLTPRRMFSARITEINAASISRGVGAILNIEGVTAAQIGSDERVTALTIADYNGVQQTTSNVANLAALNVVRNGMVAPWMYDNRDSQFLTYAEGGFVGAGFNYVLASAGTVTATTAAVTGTERLLINGAAATLPVGFNLNVWALRADFGVSLATVTDLTAQVTIGSGGIIAGANSTSIMPKIVFGSVGTPVEAIVNVTANTLTLGDVANPTIGQITATAITKGSAGALQLDAEQNAGGFSGPINVGGTGALTLRTNATTVTGGNPAAFSGTSFAGGNGGTIFLNGVGTTINFRSEHTQTYGQTSIGGVATELGAETFANSIAIRAGNPLAAVNFDRITAITNQGISISGGLTFGGSPGDQGQVLTVSGANGMNAQGAGFNFWVNGVTNTGPAGNAIINITNANNQSMSLAGGITGAGTLVREGSSTGTLFVGVNGVTPPVGAGSTFTGGVTVISGILQANAVAPTLGGNVTGNFLGTGPVTLAGGQLNVRADSATPNFATLTGGSTTNASTAVTVATTAGLTVGMIIYGPNIAAGTTIATIPTGTTLTLSANATATATAQTFNAAGDTQKVFTFNNPVTVLGNTTLNADRVANVNIFPNVSTTNGSNIITLSQGTTAGLTLGQTVSGTGITGQVQSITDATHFVTSQNASATGTVTATVQTPNLNNILAFPTLNIGGQTLISSSANTYGVGFNAVNLSSTPTFQTNNDLNLTGVTDNGGGLYLVKNGTAQLWMSSTNANTYSGGTVINQGVLRFGTQLAENTTAKAGTGLITINAQGAIRVANATNFNVGQQLQVNGMPNSPAVVRILGTATISAAQVASIVTPTSSRGALLLEATYANALDLSLIGDGTFYLGSQGNISYTALTLTAGAGGVYRLGQSNAAASVLTLAPTTAASPVLSGGNSLIVGSLAAGFNNGTGTVLLNATNTFTSGAMVARLSNLRFTTGATQGFGGTGLLNTPLGSGAVDAFGTLTAEGTAGTFVNQGQTAATNPVNIHPGAIIRLDNNTSITGAVTGTGAGSQITALASTAGLSVGMTVISSTAGFPAGGATIVSIDSATDITLSIAPPAGALAGVQFASNNRWDDSTPVALRGAQFFVNGLNTGISNETVASLSFATGSNIRLLANGTNGQAVLTIGGANTISRVGFGTLVFNDGAAGRLGLAAASTSERVFVTGGVANILDDAGAPVVISNGMLPAYYVAGADNTFVNYDVTNGFTRAAYTPAALNLPAGRVAGTDLAQVTGNVTLADNPNIYALGVTAAATILNAPGQINTITLDGTGATAKTFGGIIAASAAIVINPNIRAGSSGQFELPIFSNGTTLQLNGDISAAGITKFGSGQLLIGKDQSDLARGTGAGYSNGWVVNEGQLTPLTFGSLGNATPTNTVTLNGATVSPTNANITNASTLRLALNQANTGIAYYSMGNLNVLDNGGISLDPGVDDRTQALGSAAALSNVVVTSTGGALLDAQFSLNTNRNRTVLLVGDLSLSGTNAGVQVNIITSNQTSNVTTGTSSGISVASVTGTADQRVEKWGNGVFYVRGASTFAGAVNIEQGALQINNVASLGNGSGTNVVTVKRFGTLDINTANFARTDVIFQSGSLLRLTADQAIASPAFNLGGGTLQVANDQTTTATQFTMTGGGSIEGFLRTDDLLNNASAAGLTNGTRAVYRTLGAGVTFNLVGNSFVGQNINQGVNGLDNGVQADVFNPLLNSANGVLLEIKGVISGPGSLTKQGYDTVTISGANTYSGGTNVTQGLLRAGATNVLGTSDGVTSGTGNLTTSGASAFDVNGFNQSIGRLTSLAATGTAVAGYVTNTATTINTLSVGNNVAGGNFTYAGVIQNNVALAKQGGATFTLTKDNTFAGATTVNGGTVEVQGRLSGTSNVAINAGATFLLNSSVSADNIVNPSADVLIASGTMRIDNSKTGTTQTYCNLTLSGAPTLDFGTGTTDRLVFQRLLTNLNAFGGTLSIWNWTGTQYGPGALTDSGDPTQDRLLFNFDSYGNGSSIGNVQFFSDSGATPIGTGAGQVAFGSQFELVPVPEPVTTALLGSVALCALLRYRGRHRTSGIRSRVARK